MLVGISIPLNSDYLLSCKSYIIFSDLVLKHNNGVALYHEPTLIWHAIWGACVILKTRSRVFGDVCESVQVVSFSVFFLGVTRFLYYDSINDLNCSALHHC
jgi:hypothetical protein